MKLHTLLQHLHLWQSFKGDNPTILSIENDHRKVTQGSLFVCIKGFTVDGHDLAQQAVERGAVAILSEKPMQLSVPVFVVNSTTRALAILADAFLNHPTQRLHLIGVTGTNGKTTISHLIEHIFQLAQYKTGMIGTIHTKIGNKTYEVKNTTPESLTLQKTFKQMVEEQVQMAVMEVSSHALHMGRVHGCEFNVAVFSNLTQDHLDYHETMDEYRHAKGLLFSQLGNTFDPLKPKYAILNIDDAASDSYMKVTAAHVVTYGIDKTADISASNISITAKGTTFELKTPVGNKTISMSLIGKFSVYNVLAATSACLVSGLSLDHICSAIEQVTGVSGRFELVDAGQSFAIIVDYAHTPDSLENVLKTVQQFAQNKIFVVVGCGGDRDRTKRPLMAKIACEFATDPIFTSDNPRSEEPVAILKDMEEGVKGQSFTTIIDRKEAIQYAIHHANEGDVIVIAGKGHETYQIIGQDVLDFDDRLIAREIIQQQ